MTFRTVFFASAVAAIAALDVSAAFAQQGPRARPQLENEGGQVYYFEIIREGRLRWGWNASPLGISPRAASIPSRSIREACNRAVGRDMISDSPAQIFSTQAVEACVRRGGVL